jgi:phosphoribosylformylglycinamidine synthase
MLGVLDSKKNRMTLDFKQTGDLIYMVGEAQNDIASSEYLYSFHKVKNAPAPYFNLEQEYEMQDVVKGLIRERLIQSAHDCADGGLYITLLESAMHNNLGFNINTDADFRKDAYLFGEAQGRVVVSVKPEQQEAFVELMANSSVEFTLLGEVTAGDLLIDGESFGTIAESKNLFDNALGAYLN